MFFPLVAGFGAAMLLHESGLCSRSAGWPERIDHNMDNMSVNDAAVEGRIVRYLDA
jgi:hypothetical protein